MLADEPGMNFSAIALQGVEQAQIQLEAAASSVASAGASPDGANLDTVDLASGITGLSSAQAQLQLSLSTLKTADQIQQNILDLLA